MSQKCKSPYSIVSKTIVARAEQSLSTQSGMLASGGGGVAATAAAAAQGAYYRTKKQRYQ